MNDTNHEHELREAVDFPIYCAECGDAWSALAWVNRLEQVATDANAELARVRAERDALRAIEQKARACIQDERPMYGPDAQVWFTTGGVEVVSCGSAEELADALNAYEALLAQHPE